MRYTKQGIRDLNEKQQNGKSRTRGTGEKCRYCKKEDSECEGHDMVWLDDAWFIQ